MRLKRASVAILTALGLVVGLGPAASADEGGDGNRGTDTPIQHLVVIFQENVSFDHYFGTYPNALNPAGEPAFHALPGTPEVRGLSPQLLNHNPNLSNPQRLDVSQARTCDQNHDYTAEQKAVDLGKMDHFVQALGNPTDPTGVKCSGKATGTSPNYTVMDYYDGNTVTALWNYAQHFAMSDNSFGTGYGPSTPGALNLTAGQTFGATCTTPEVFCSAGATVGTVTGDPQPTGDKCDTRDTTAISTGRNVGDLLTARSVTWGWFNGGFSSCTQSHTVLDQNGKSSQKADYIPHHQPFQYFASTANLQHLPPTKPAGQQDQANHQYDLTNFWQAVDTGNMPAVSFLKPSAYQDGHPGYSNPLDEQTFLVDTLNRLQQRREWANTAVVIAYDDSDGWYDHVLGKIVRQSQTPLDALTGVGQCGDNPNRVPGGESAKQQGRCGLGPRLPLLVISPFAKQNYVDHHLTDQSSILRFIEDNWQLGRIGNASADRTAGSLNNLFNFEGDNQGDSGGSGKLFLNPATGTPAAA